MKLSPTSTSTSTPTSTPTSTSRNTASSLGLATLSSVGSVFMNAASAGERLAGIQSNSLDQQIQMKCDSLRSDGHSEECVTLAQQAMSGFFAIQERFKEKPDAALKQKVLQVFEQHIPHLIDALLPQYKEDKSKFIQSEFQDAKTLFLHQDKSREKDLFWHLLVLTKSYETQNGGGINGAEITTLDDTLARLSAELQEHFNLAHQNNMMPVSCAVEALVNSVSADNSINIAYQQVQDGGISTGVYTADHNVASFISMDSRVVNNLQVRAHTFQVGASTIMLVHNEAVTNTDKEPQNLENFLAQVATAWQVAKSNDLVLPIVGGDPNINVFKPDNRSAIQAFCTRHECVFVHPKDGYSKARDPANPWKNPQLKKGVLPGHETQAESMGVFIPQKYYCGLLPFSRVHVIEPLIASLKEGESIKTDLNPEYKIAFKDIATDHVPLGPIIVDCSNGTHKPQLIRFTNDGEITHPNKGLKKNVIYDTQKMTSASFKLMIDLVGVLNNR